MSNFHKTLLSNDNSSEHPCAKEGELGAINARLDSQESTDNRIEAAVQKLVEDHRVDTRAIDERFADIGVKLAKIGATLETSTEQNKQLIKTQSDILEHLNSVTKVTDLMEEHQKIFQNVVNQHIAENEKWKRDISKRVHKLELTKFFWYTLAFVIIGMLSALSYLATIYDVFNDPCKNVKSAETVTSAVDK